MKFKIASIVGLIVPLSIASMLTVFAGCGGGAYGANAAPYDGTWSLNFKGYTKPDGTGTVTCTERYTNITISHGSGSATELIDCTGTASPTYSLDVGVTLTPDATGITGTVKVIATGGGTGAGTCIDRLTCEGPGLSLYKCGTAASGC